MDFSIASILMLDGATNGAIYALLALATVLVFAVTRVIFIPQGEFVAYGALTLALLQMGKVPGTVWLLAVLALTAALLDVIAFAEGTRGQSNDGYNVTFGFRTFATCEHHPRMLVCEGLCSDAAGRYQFLSTTWEEVGLKTFTPDNQDRAAIQRVVGRGGHIPSDRPLSGAEFSALMDIISFEWASLPPGRFGQTAHSFGEVRSEYCRAVGGC